MKRHFRRDYYLDEKRREFSISKIKYVEEGFEKWFEEFSENLKQIQRLHKIGKKHSYYKNQEYEKTGFRTDIGFYLAKMFSNKCFGFIQDFIEVANHKNDTDRVDSLKQRIKNFGDQLGILVERYIPSQSVGLCIARGSMNYFAVNKKPKEYYEDKLEKLEKEKEEILSKYVKTNGLLFVENKKQPYKFKEAERKWFEEYPKIKDSQSKEVEFTLEETYNLIKEFKAKMKSIFSEKIKKDNAESIRQEFYLFDSPPLEDYMGKSKYIDTLNKNPSFHNRREITNMKKQRGKAFLNEGKKNWRDKKFMNWIGFCESYKKVAIKRGKLKAQIKGIEMERIEAENNKYWVLVLDNGKDKNILLVPKENMGEVKNYLGNLNSENPDNTIYVLNSLTKRALHKLCFAEESTFASEMREKDSDLFNQLQEVKRATNDGEKVKKQKNINSKSKDDLMLPFLKNVLRSDYTKKRIDLDDFDLEKVFNSQELEEFEEELERACYNLKKISISQNELNQFLEKYNIISFKITSYDIEKRFKNTYQTPESDYKRHTKEIWNGFWRGGETVRINPEIKIHLKRQDPILRNYLSCKNFDLDKIKHRNLENKITLTTSFSLNAGKKYPDLAFVKTKDLLEKINEFNDDFNKNNWDDFYKYGIDRGQVELATLCIAKFEKGETYEVNGKTLIKPKFPEGEEDIKVYELKKEFYDKFEKPSSKMVSFEDIKPRRVIANISYFIDRVEDGGWFDEKTCTCIDLTTAKVIKDKIVLNGDILTFLKLKYESAKKHIFESYSEDSTLEWEENPEDKSRIPMKLDGEKIYYFVEDFEGLLISDKMTYTKENVFNALQKYLDELKDEAYSKHKPTTPKLNHLRDSLVANMVGVISFLQKKYSGFVILEDLDVSHIEKHFRDDYSNISRRLEFSLFNKFQTMGLVPPHIKNLIEIREDMRSKNRDKHSSQFGAVVFVDEGGTSKQCPYCEESWNWSEGNNDGRQTMNNLKYIQKRFLCGKHESSECEFDTKNIFGKYGFLKEINDPDKVAAYNVAKKIRDYEDIGKSGSSDK